VKSKRDYHVTIFVSFMTFTRSRNLKVCSDLDREHTYTVYTVLLVSNSYKADGSGKCSGYIPQI
jgi:hypothetical protein